MLPLGRWPLALAAAGLSYARIAWWGLVSPRLGGAGLVVHQAVIEEGDRVLLAIRHDLRGWELPGGGPLPGEAPDQTLRREVAEETGLRVAVGECVGRYQRTGFRPHTAIVHRCTVEGGALTTSHETLALRWFEADALPETLFPWYRQPLADARARGPSVDRSDHQGLAAILAGLRIDLRTRLSEDPR